MNLLCIAGVACLLASPAFGQATYSPTVTPADLAAAAAQNLAIMAATTPQFVGGSSAFQTRAQLLAGYPCNSVQLGYLAHVSDVYGSVASTLVCETDGNTYYWRPQRADYSVVSTQTTGTLTLTPLTSAPIIYLSSTPTGTVGIALSTTNAWPGATFHIYAPASITLNGINITGLIGGGTVPLLQGTDKIVTYTTSGWKAN